MLGRGVKRKWSCLQEAEPPPSAEKESPGADGEGRGYDSPAGRLQQRQRVLGLCVEKLRGVELGLRRSVLLANTLRQIQEDMLSERGRRGGAATWRGEAATWRGEAATGPGEANAPGGCDLGPDVDVFEDIDTSMFDPADLWPVSVAMWADEDAKRRPVQSCMDLNELDHIMEILVRS